MDLISSTLEDPADEFIMDNFLNVDVIPGTSEDAADVEAAIPDVTRARSWKGVLLYRIYFPHEPYPEPEPLAWDTIISQ